MRIKSGVRAVGSISGRSRIWNVGALFLLLSAAVLLASCGNDTGDAGNGATDGEETQAAGEADVSVSEIINQPEEFYDQTVTVSGPVVQVIDSTRFVITSEEILDERGEDFFESNQNLAENGLLIATRGGESPEISATEAAQVTGEVQQFDQQSFETQVGIGFNSSVYNDFSQRPAVIANEVQQMGGGSTGQQ